MVLRIGYGASLLNTFTRNHNLTFIPVREHFCSPLLQFEAEDKDSTFTLIECPSASSPILCWGHLFITLCNIGGTGQLISRLTNDEIDIAMCARPPDFQVERGVMTD